MLVSNIIGGLGNQMFQYAAGRARSLKLDVPLKLDTSDSTKGVSQRYLYSSQTFRSVASWLMLYSYAIR